MCDARVQGVTQRLKQICFALKSVQILFFFRNELTKKKKQIKTLILKRGVAQHTEYTYCIIQPKRIHFVMVDVVAG